MIIVPGINNDGVSEADLVSNVKEFFARYTQREPGCLRYAEVVNEANLAVSGYGSPAPYASYYEKAAPIPKSYGIEVITSGTSGEDLTWTTDLSSLLQNAQVTPPVNGFGFHPYGVPPSEMVNATTAMRSAAGTSTWYTGQCAATCIFVTEIGETNPTALYNTIVNLAWATPTVTIYEYKEQPGDNTEYGLVDHPSLYSAVKDAWAYVRSQQPTPPPPPEAIRNSRSARAGHTASSPALGPSHAART